MKWIFIGLLLQGICFAQDLQPPDFSEFYSPMKQTGWQAFKGGGLWGAMSKGKQDEKDNQYWQKRKAVFESEINNCNQLTDPAQKVNCYMQVRQIETQKTTAYTGQTQEAWEAKRTNRLQRMLLTQPASQRNINCNTLGQTTNCSSY